MPTYQYACTDPECGNRFELVQSFTDPAASACPVCQHSVRKVYGSVGVVFKGSGFYRTDSRASANGSSSAESGSKSDAGKPDSKSDAKSGTKSESKSDSAPKSDSKSSAGSSAGTSSTPAAASA